MNIPSILRLRVLGMATALSATCLLLAGCGGAAPAGNVNFDELVAAERAFAATSRAGGMREAFLEYLAPGSIVFRPGPVDGREAFAGPSPAGTLDWYPERAEVSASGDLGYTTGPWEYSTEGQDSGFGHYISVWRRQDDGTWRVALDIGNNHARPPTWSPEAAPRNSGKPPSTGTDAEGLEARLIEGDRSLLRRAQESGTLEAYREVAATDLTLYRDGLYPVEGAKAFDLLTAATDRVVDGVPVQAGLSRSGDLGYTYGTLRVQDEESAASRSYARIWRRDDDTFRLVIDVQVPMPAPGDGD